MIAAASARLAHRLIQIGMTLFLLGLVIGIAVPAFTAPRLALSTHLLLITQGLFLMMLGGIVWPRLSLSAGTTRAAFFLAIYACLAASLANLAAAALGAGNSIVPIAAGEHRGSDTQEFVITLLLRSGGAAFIVTSIMMLIGLRMPASE